MRSLCHSSDSWQAVVCHRAAKSQRFVSIKYEAAWRLTCWAWIDKKFYNVKKIQDLQHLEAWFSIRQGNGTGFFKWFICNVTTCFLMLSVSYVRKCAHFKWMAIGPWSYPSSNSDLYNPMDWVCWERTGRIDIAFLFFSFLDCTPDHHFFLSNRCLISNTTYKNKVERQQMIMIYHKFSPCANENRIFRKVLQWFRPSHRFIAGISFSHFL